MLTVRRADLDRLEVGKPTHLPVRGGSVVVLAPDRLLTASHCVVGALADPGEAQSPSLSVVGDLPRPARVLERGDPRRPMGDWALLEVTPMDAPPVAALAEPVLGERCVLIGYPPRMVSGSWGGTLLLEGGESPGWRPPPPVVIEGRVTSLNAWNGYRVAAPGAGGSWLDGISGGGAFVERDGRWALIGIVTHGHVAPFRSEIGVRPLNEAARDAWSTPPATNPGFPFGQTPPIR